MTCVHVFIALNLVLQQARILVISTYGVRMPVREIKHDFTLIQFCQKKTRGIDFPRVCRELTSLLAQHVSSVLIIVPGYY